MTQPNQLCRRLLPPAGLLLGPAATSLWLTPADARREMLAAADKERLQRAERIHLDALALTDKGATDAAGIAAVVTAGLTALGYRVEQGSAQPHDVVVKVKCEEHKTWEGTARSGGDADTPGASSRLWRGPACQLSYRLDTVRSDWRHEVRVESPEGRDPVATGQAAEEGDSVLARLSERLSQDPFPLLLAAEWGHSARLLTVLEKPGTDAATKARIIQLLGGMGAADAMPALTRSLGDPDLTVANAAAVAIGAIGHRDGIPLLLTVFTNGRTELHRAAAQGLGRLAPLHPQADIVPALLASLPNAPVPVQTEIVRALATTADQRSYEDLRRLNREIQTRHATDRSPEIQALKGALGTALDQFTNTHSADE